ncbi:Fatty acid elongase [Spraguea lophii 42_110]|uniref:Elongation of fatty acids protein n=1 Tax=Spraguea lophii (strain 42_110) TaxID=1358809 RepID=S7W8H8_SPRLO|nr:Fatty acid elongase [Spraguea lophii 42_110]
MLQSLHLMTLDYKFPSLMVVLYLIYVNSVNKKMSGNYQRGFKLRYFMILHNLGMSAFSFYVFIRSITLVYRFYTQNSLIDAASDSNNVLSDGIYFYSYIFYISKIYEITDTLILHMNRKKASFLQSFHHAGAIIATWLLCVSYSHLSWIFVVLNSFVHLIMYFYYFLATLGIKVRIKKIITTMQMVQFVSGIIMLLGHFYIASPFKGDQHTQKMQVIALIFNTSYALVLLMLFRLFFKKTYETKNKKE